jgi:hypothetical protein
MRLLDTLKKSFLCDETNEKHEITELEASGRQSPHPWYRIISSTETSLPKCRVCCDVIRERLPIVWCSDLVHRIGGETAFEKARQRGGVHARR